MRTYNLTTQYPANKQKTTPNVLVNAIPSTKGGLDAICERDGQILGVLYRAELKTMAANGIALSGFEDTGRFDKSGLPVYRYQEWWLAYRGEEKGEE